MENKPKQNKKRNTHSLFPNLQHFWAKRLQMRSPAVAAVVAHRLRVWPLRSKESAHRSCSHHHLLLSAVEGNERSGCDAIGS